MDDLAKMIFDQANLIGEGQRIAGQLGRAQMALEVLAWAHRHAHLIAGAPVESLLALCNRELVPFRVDDAAAPGLEVQGNLQHPGERAP